MEQLIFPITKRDAEKSGRRYSSEANKNALFPSQLRKLRKEKGVSQEVLARDIGVSKSTIGLYETGDTLPDAKTLHDLAVYFGVSADWLLGISSVKRINKDVRSICDYTGLDEESVYTLAGWKEEKGEIERAGNKNIFILDTLNNLISSNCKEQAIECDISFSFRVLLECLSVLGDIHIISDKAIKDTTKKDIIEKDGLFDYSNDKNIWRDIEELRATKALYEIFTFISRFGIQRA